MQGPLCLGACGMTQVMKGYEMRPHMEKDPNAEAFTDGYMRSRAASFSSSEPL